MAKVEFYSKLLASLVAGTHFTVTDGYTVQVLNEAPGQFWQIVGHMKLSNRLTCILD